MKLLYFDRLKKMLPQQMDKLPGPVEFRATLRTRGKERIEGRRKRWVGMGWVDEDVPHGDEALLVMDRDDPHIPQGMEEWSA